MSVEAVSTVWATPEICRFSLADLSSHGHWVLPRVLKAYPHLSERNAAGWMRSIIDSNEHLFLRANHAVACAEMVHGHTLAPHPAVIERFVFAQEEEFIPDAAAMYDEFARWARSLGAKTIIVEEMSDVPHEMVTARLGTIRAIITQKYATIRL